MLIPGHLHLPSPLSTSALHPQAVPLEEQISLGVSTSGGLCPAPVEGFARTKGLGVEVFGPPHTILPMTA